MEPKHCEACGQDVLACATCGTESCVGLMTPIPDREQDVQEGETVQYYCEVCFDKAHREEN